MKKVLLFFGWMLLFTSIANAQVPQGIPYQAVARNGQGQPLASTNVKVRFSVLDSTATGTAVYVESHSTATSALGLFSANVGMGTASTGTFSSINWGQNYKFLKVELDTTATGNSYIDLGTQQMMSVPYALYAGRTNESTYVQAQLSSLQNQLSNLQLIVNPTITNGTQFWASTNLDVTTYRDGTPIPQVTNQATWASLTTGAWCYYNNDSANGAIYGKLYNWYAVVGIYDAASLTNPALRKQLAPSGWHVPSDVEWSTFTAFLGGEGIAGAKLKEAGVARWAIPNTDATNSSGFTGLPGGCRGNTFFGIGTTCNLLSSTEASSITAWYRQLFSNNGTVNRTNGGLGKWCGFSVRCLKD